MNRAIKIRVFRVNHIIPGIQVNGAILIKGSQPPQKRRTFRADIRIIFEYSPRENRAKPIADYSTLYPDTSSASASGRSKG